MAKRLKDILDLIKLDLEERNTLTRDQWNGICAIKVTIDERLMRKLLEGADQCRRPQATERPHVQDRPGPHV